MVLLIRFIFILLFFSIATTNVQAQDLFAFIENCKFCNGKVKTLKILERVENVATGYSTRKQIVHTYSQNKQLTKTQLYFDGRIQKTIQYYYKDSLLIYEEHKQPKEDDFFYVYQYYQKKVPGAVLKVDSKRRIKTVAKIEYTKDFRPVYLKIYDLLGNILERKTLEYYGRNYVLISTFNPKTKSTNVIRHELLCKYNKPQSLKKRDFKDIITKPINLEFKDKTIQVVKAVQISKKKEKIHIEELTYDSKNNWLSKKTFELKNNKNKRRLLRKIDREIEYY